ncbi:response regulator transcription factor [Paenibacillus crassostreae]|uniref:Two-component system response regulator n=1 Tax=Paenibacillus crassostreae TaxID=1763538 RepID=A0A167B960_9BACL|nr:response regulator transcription factor [Paenibacillus crassostreae]AOZ93061.1 DNA-binding response regulator [Paenibacillus crassostreae]OAB71850.1 two-component system response regulator [Paenibacillus crassostreae]
MFRVILVDDEMYTRKGLMKLIDWEACGFQVVGEADNGEDALELIKDIQPELVITDIRMPVLDGLELIRRVTEEGIADPMFIILSGYDDFNYAQKALRYGVHDFILKPVDEIEFAATLQILREKLTSDRANRDLENNLLTGAMIEALILDHPDDAFLAEWEDRLMLKEVKGLYYMFAEMNDTHLSSEVGTSLSLSGFKETLQRTLQQITGGGQPFYLHEHRSRIGFIVPDSIIEIFQGEVRAFAETLLQHLKKETELRIFLYAGCKVECLADIRDSYRSAKEVLQYKYMHDDTGIVIHEGTLPTLQYISLDDGVYKQLVEQIEEMAFDKLDHTIKMMFANFRDKCYAPEAVKMNIHQCVMIIVKTMNEMGGDEQEISTLDKLLNWNDLNLSLSELRNVFAVFAEESGQYIAELRKKKHSGDIQKIRAYIESHYQENISLKSIAAQFYVNPVYLGQLFKKTYGVYFNDFLQQLRMNEAKRLLRQTDLRIYEVSERIGFGNSDYFVTKFEKMEGMTPSEYRNSLNKGGVHEDK